MFNIRGKLVALNDGKMRELTVDKGKLGGDLLFIVEIRTILEWLEGNKEPVGPGHYKPKGKYLEDELAILLAAREVAEDTEVEGDFPIMAEPAEGVIH